MFATTQPREFARPVFAGPAFTANVITETSIDATARGGFWITEPANVGVDAATASLRARIRDASMMARLSGMLRMAR